MDDKTQVEQMKVLKVTISPKPETMDGPCTEHETPTMPMQVKAQCNAVNIPSETKHGDKRDMYSRIRKTVNHQSMPLMKQSILVSNDVCKPISSSDQTVPDEVADAISLCSG